MREQMSGMSVECFEALVAPHLQALYGFACRRTRSSSNAEDLVQDTLLRAWDRIGSLKEPDRARSWLFAIMVNLHNEQARKQARRRRLAPVVDLGEAFDDHVVSAQDSPLAEVIRGRMVAAVHEALGQVPDVYAMALELRDIEGLAYKEIAQVLGVPQGTVMSRVGRGRKIMAKLLVEWRDMSLANAA